MLAAYPAVFIKDADGYSVVFPDLNDLATCGESLDNAFAMGIDCLAGYLYTTKKDGEAVKAPSPLSAIDGKRIAAELGEGDAAEIFVNMVTVDVEEYAKKHFEKAVRKNVTIPAWLNEAAMAKKINFSQALQDALRSQLGLG